MRGKDDSGIFPPQDMPEIIESLKIGGVIHRYERAVRGFQGYHYLFFQILDGDILCKINPEISRRKFSLEGDAELNA